MSSKNQFEPIVKACSNLLHSEQATIARTYLDRRLDPEAQATFGFGWFPPSEHLAMLFTEVSKEQLFELSLLYERYINSDYQLMSSTMEHHNLILPYRDVYGEIVALVGRSLLDDVDRQRLNIAKYKNTSFPKKRHLFGLYEARHAILKHNCVYVTEGQFDVVQAHNKQITNTVALGSSNMSFNQLALLLRYTDNIWLVLDNDEAGEMGRERILSKYGKHANWRNLRIPSGFKDLDEFLREEQWEQTRPLHKVLS